MDSFLLAIESSCDETAVAVLSDKGVILSEKLASQIAVHALYGGVVPEVASRSHFEILDSLVKECLEDAANFEGISVDSLSSRLKAVAATTGPGLVGPLLVEHPMREASREDGTSLLWEFIT